MVDFGVLTRITQGMEPEESAQLVSDVIRAYLADAPSQIVAIREAALGTGGAALEHAAHKLKGSSVCIGARDLAQLCDRLERMGLTRTADGAAQLSNQIEAEFASVRAILEPQLDISAAGFFSAAQAF
jgi:HPt (histidine-containing phosphotransfer) domain-containing protein